MNSSSLITMHHSYAAISHLKSIRIEVTDLGYFQLRNAAFSLLGSLRNEAEILHPDGHEIFQLVRPLIHAKSLPIDFRDDEFGFGECFQDNIDLGRKFLKNSAPQLLQKFDHYIACAKKASEVTVENPIREQVKKHLVGVSSKIASEGRYGQFGNRIAILRNKRHERIWQEIIDEVSSNCFPVVIKQVRAGELKDMKCGAVFTVGTLHSWKNDWLGWPDWIRTAPSAPLLANVRWAGDEDVLPIDMFDIDQIPSWDCEVKSITAVTPIFEPELVDDRLHVQGDWSAEMFEDFLLGPGHRQSGIVPYRPSESEEFKVLVHTACGSSNELDSDDDDWFIASKEGPTFSINGLTILSSETIEQKTPLLLLNVLDDDYRDAMVISARETAMKEMVERRKRQRKWKTRLGDFLDSDSQYENFVARLCQRVGDGTTFTKAKLRDWSKQKVDSIHAPGNKKVFAVLLEEMGLGEYTEQYWEDAEYFRFIGARAGNRTGQVIRQSLETEIKKFAEEQHDELSRGETIIIDALNGEIMAEVTLIESFRIMKALEDST